MGTCGEQSCGCTTPHRAKVHLDWPNRRVYDYSRADTRPVTFVGHGGANACDVKSGDTIYTGCNHVYHKHGDATAQCGHAESLTFYTRIPVDGWGGNYRYDTDATTCPGVSGASKKYAIDGHKKNACFYSKTDASQLKGLSNSKGTDHELTKMHDALSDKFCSVRDNITKDPGGTSCWDRKHGTDLAREYCGVGNRITSDMCDIGKTNHIGRQVYEDLAKAYCKTPQGVDDEWCACQNVIRDSGAWCKKNPTKPGCKDVMPHYDALLATVPTEFRGKFPIETIKCMKNVCTDRAGRWNPESWDDQCRNTTQICHIDFKEIVNSDIGTINAKCNQMIKDNQKAAADDAAAAAAAATATRAAAATTQPTKCPQSVLDVG